MMSEIIGWVGTLLLVISIWKIGNRRRSGFLLCVLGEVFWIARGLSLHAPDLVVVCAVFMLLNVRAFIKWKTI